jgi:hypothetical protein
LKKQEAQQKRKAASNALKQRQSAESTVKGRSAKDADHQVIAGDFEGAKEKVAATLEANMSLPVCKLCGGILEAADEVIMTGMEKMHKACLTSTRDGGTLNKKAMKWTPFQAARRAEPLITLRVTPGVEAKKSFVSTRDITLANTAQHWTCFHVSSRNTLTMH